MRLSRRDCYQAPLAQTPTQASPGDLRIHPELAEAIIFIPNPTPRSFNLSDSSHQPAPKFGNLNCLWLRGQGDEPLRHWAQWIKRQLQIFLVGCH